MGSMITMYDVNDIKIGETFFRRAKQLVKQQRATWTDDDQKAIKFLQGTENLSEETEEDSTQDKTDDKWLFEIAKKRIFERKLFKWHSIAFLPGLFIAFLVAGAVVDAAFSGDAALLFFGLSWGSWITAYILHVFFYVNKYLNSDNASKKAKRERELAAEVELIKSELSA